MIWTVQPYGNDIRSLRALRSCDPDLEFVASVGCWPSPYHHFSCLPEGTRTFRAQSPIVRTSPSLESKVRTPATPQSARGWSSPPCSSRSASPSLAWLQGTCLSSPKEKAHMQDVSLSSLMRVRAAPNWLDTSSSRAAGQAQKAADLVLNQPPSTWGA